jgi:hypothetical protein
MEMEERLVVLSGGNVVTKSCVQDLHAKLLKFSKEFQGPKAFVVMTHLVKKAENPSHELLTGELGPLAAITEHDYNQLLGVGDNDPLSHFRGEASNLRSKRTRIRRSWEIFKN